MFGLRRWPLETFPLTSSRNRLIMLEMDEIDSHFCFFPTISEFHRRSPCCVATVDPADADAHTLYRASTTPSAVSCGHPERVNDPSRTVGARFSTSGYLSALTLPQEFSAALYELVRAVRLVRSAACPSPRCSVERMHCVPLAYRCDGERPQRKGAVLPGKCPIIRLYVHSVALNAMQQMQTVRNYSYLSATMGSTFIARRAGK